jgi:hypothetical protein
MTWAFPASDVGEATHAPGWGGAEEDRLDDAYAVSLSAGGVGQL